MRRFFSRQRLWFALILLIPLGFLIGVARQRPQTIVGVGSAPIALAFSSDNRPIMTTQNGNLQIFEPSQNSWRIFRTHFAVGEIHNVLLRSGKNKRLYTLRASVSNPDSPFISVWNTSTQKLIYNIKVPPETLVFSLSDDEKSLAIGTPTRARLQLGRDTPNFALEVAGRADKDFSGSPEIFAAFKFGRARARIVAGRREIGGCEFGFLGRQRANLQGERRARVGAQWPAITVFSRACCTALLA